VNRNKMASWWLLGAVFALNWAETAVETWIKGGRGAVPELGYRLAYAFQQIEGGGLFALHEASGPLAVYSYSLVYFFVFPLLALGLALALSCAREDWPLRVFARALAIDYAVSLPFFLLFPVPERWAYPGSGAMLLSDRWSSALIEAVRPVSGLDNCFPSFHVSMSVVIVAMAFVAGLRLRTAVLAVGTTVVLATFGLGIHWLPDIAAGVAAGILGVAVAMRLELAGAPAPAPSTATAA
jgi:PAP2 superfamily